MAAARRAGKGRVPMSSGKLGSVMELQIKALKKERSELLERADSAEKWRAQNEKQNATSMLQRVSAAEQKAEEALAQREGQKEATAKALAQLALSKAEVRQYEDRMQALQKELSKTDDDKEMWRERAVEAEAG